MQSQAIATNLRRFFSAIAQLRQSSLSQGSQAAAIAAECCDLREALLQLDFDPEELRTAINQQCTDLRIRNFWIGLLEKHNILPTTPTLPSTPGSLVRVSTAQKATKIQRRSVEASDVFPVLYAPGHGDILKRICSSKVSLFLSGASNSGKSTLARAIMWMIHKIDPTARFFVVEPQDETWLGLEKYTSIVNYCEPGSLNAPVQVIRKLHEIYVERYGRMQQAARQGRSISPGGNIWGFINEWNDIYEEWAALTVKEKKDLEVDDLLPKTRKLFRSGRRAGVRLVMMGQEHTKLATGFSRQLMNSVAVVSTGLILPDGSGGYKSVYDLIADNHLIKGEHQRNVLKQVYQEAVGNRTPLLATTLGIPTLAELPDFSGAKSQNILSTYQHAPTFEVPASSSTLRLVQ